MKRSALFSGVFLFLFSIVALLPPGALAQEKNPCVSFSSAFQPGGYSSGAHSRDGYLPEAKSVCEEFPTISDTVENFTANIFNFETVRPVVQQTCSSLKKLGSRAQLRADTS